MTGINTGLDNKRISMNIIFSLIALITNMFISFFITPKITSTLGAEAYGFVKLANDFANYGSLFSLAINSMSSRFIMISLEKKDINSAKGYYTSVTIANIVLSIVLLIPCVLLIFFLNQIINISITLIWEVRLTFIWTFSNFLICLACSTFGNCFFLKNRLDISSLITSLTSIIKAIFILVMFEVFGPSISFVAMGGLVVTSIFVPCNVYYHKKLTPDLNFDKTLFSFEKLKELLFSGIWNSITKLSQILTTGLDMLITNLLVGSIEMGYLSVAKTVPNLIFNMINTIGNSFTPNLTQLFARDEKEQLIKAIKSSIRIMCLFSSIPSAILIVFGLDFFSLWVPEQPTEIINILSILSILSAFVVGPMQPLYQVFTITNKIKESSIIYIVSGIISFGLTFAMIKYFNIGVYAVASVSGIISILVALLYHLPMSAVYLGLPKFEFFPEIVKAIILLIIECLIGTLIDYFIALEKSWISWFISALLLGLISLILNVIIIFSKDERRKIKVLFKVKVKKVINNFLS